MKKQFVYAATTNLPHKALGITIALLLIAQLIAAQTRTVAVVAPAPPPAPAASVKHIGNPPGSLVFQVQYDNPAGEKFFLTIKDTDGAILFQDMYTDKKFNKKFQLPQGETDKLQFIIKGARAKESQTFEVNTNIRMVEDIVVKKVG